MAGFRNMAQDEQEPEVIKSHMGETAYLHPAFGQIGASRVQGQATLYGSDFKHHACVILTISRSELHRSLSRDWHFGKGELISVAMSEAQWATMISSLNMGSGVPCTIRHIQGEGMPGIPHRDEAQEHKSEAGKRVQKAVEKLKAMREAAKTKGAQRELDNVLMELTSNLDFVDQAFGEHVEERIEKAKVEINAYMTGVIARAGIKALSGENAPLELETAEPEATRVASEPGKPGRPRMMQPPLEGRDGMSLAPRHEGGG